jgi:hypothetical protein
VVRHQVGSLAQCLVDEVTRYTRSYPAAFRQLSRATSHAWRPAVFLQRCSAGHFVVSAQLIHTTRAQMAKSQFFVTVLLACLAQRALAQFVSPPTNLTNATGYAGVPVRYKQVPAGICEQREDVKSYSGYADVAEDQHIFWWFFEARNMNASEAPL